MKSTYMRYPGFRTRALTLSYDDGVEQDRKFIEIIDRYSIKCTFNLNSNKFYDEPQQFEPGRIHRIMTRAAAQELYIGSGHEVAAHMLDHPHPKEITPLANVAQIFEDRKNLEEMFGTEVRGMAYPYGEYSDATIEAAKNCGIVYSRTTQSTCRFDLPTDWLRLPATCHHNSPRLMELAEDFMTRKVTQVPLLFYLWGHTYEFEQNDNWDVIERFCQRVGNSDEVWYATNIEVHDYIEAFRALRFTADGEKVFNPTCIPVCIETNEGRKLTVQPGEWVQL